MFPLTGPESNEKGVEGFEHAFKSLGQSVFARYNFHPLGILIIQQVNLSDRL